MFGTRAADLWRRLERYGEAPDLEATLGLLAAGGLVAVRPLERPFVQYILHPGVAEAGIAEAGDRFQDAVDAEIAAFWMQVFRHGEQEEMRGGSLIVVWAGRRAPLYLLRQQRWKEASTFLEAVIRRDYAAETIVTVLPLLRRITCATEGTEQGLENAGVLARALLHKSL